MQHEEIIMRIREYLTTCLKDGTLHHAYLLVGSGGEKEKLVRDICNEISGKGPVTVEGTIDAVRDLIRELSHTSADGGSRCFIIPDAGGLNQESANALLKILEEPPMDVFFFLLARTKKSVMPTVASRCHVISLPLMALENEALWGSRFQELLDAPLGTQLVSPPITEEDHILLEGALRHMIARAENTESFSHCVSAVGGYREMKHALSRHMKELRASDLFYLTSKI